MEDIIVRVGYHSREADQTRPVRFGGKMLLKDISNHSIIGSHPNSKRWHNWALYEVEGGYRVMDEFVSVYKSDNNHTGLSAVLKTPLDVARAYPIVANAAVKIGLWGPEEVTAEASEGVEGGKVAPPEYKYSESEFDDKG